MLKEFRADLHIHTCLSPCGDLEMNPSSIVKKAKEKKLDIIGIADHNSTENILAVKKVGEKEGLNVLGGIEITTREEVHILGFFNDEKTLMKIQETIYENLSGENDENYFGEQIIVDEFDRVIGKNKKLLIGATKISLEEIVNMIHSSGGLAIASHIDREGFGIIGQLGFIPQGLGLDGLEVSRQSEIHNSEFINYGFPLVSFSDAHYLADIGKAKTCFVLEEPTVSEIKKALLKKDGRYISSYT